MMQVTPAVEDRFWTKVNKTNGCWLWTSNERGGYGLFKFNGKNVQAHRFSYELKNGPISNGLSLDHLCRVTNCVNPNHLEPVTHRENVLRGASPAAQHARQTHCKHGHELTIDNIYTGTKGHRQCRACAIKNASKWAKNNPGKRKQSLDKWSIKRRNKE